MKADDGMIRLLAAAPSCARKFCLKVSNPNQAGGHTSSQPGCHNFSKTGVTTFSNGTSCKLSQPDPALHCIALQYLILLWLFNRAVFGTNLDLFWKALTDLFFCKSPSVVLEWNCGFNQLLLSEPNVRVLPESHFEMSRHRQKRGNIMIAV